VTAKREPPGGGWLKRLARVYTLAFMSIAAIAMSVIVVVMAVQVFYRYALNDSLIWAEEVARYFLILMTFLLVGVAFERGELVSVQFFMHRLPRRIAYLLTIPVYLAIIAFLVTISYYGYSFANLNARFPMPAVDFILSSILGRPVSGALSMYWLYLLIPLGCLTLAAHFAVALWRHVRSANGGGKPG
jgi:TRAP-type C4-dicarboxylate transport system permease small subunit